MTMSCATSGGFRLTITPTPQGVSESADRRAWFAAAFVLIVNALSACAVQPRMIALPDLPRPQDCRHVSSGLAVTWIVPDDPTHRRKLDSACAAIGPVVVQGDQAATRPASDAPLVVVDWNTYLGRGNLDELILKLERGDFTDGMRVGRFVLLLQEVFRNSILQFA